MFYLDIPFKDKQTIRRNCTFADYHLVVSGSAVTSGMCASYVETYQSWEKVSEGHVTSSYDPSYAVSYETGDFSTGCFYYKCPNGYAWALINNYCKQGHCNTGTYASGYPSCPHGYIKYNEKERAGHCRLDSGYDTPGYRAPCGRTTRIEGEQWGYVTRTRTTTYDKEKQFQEIMHILTHLNKK